MNQKIVRTRQRMPKILNKEQIIKILRNVDNPRVAMAIFLSIFFGLRISEMASSRDGKNYALKWENVDLEYLEITIRNAKNTRRFVTGYGKDRKMPIFDEFLHIFKLWRELHPNSTYVLPSKWNTRDPVNTRYIQSNVQRALEKSGLQVVDYYQYNGVPRYKYHFHTFRHVCATNLLRRGMNIEQVKEFLGHARIATTMMYLNMVTDDLRESLTHALAYPKQRDYYMKSSTPQINTNQEALLRLENENLKLKLQMKEQMAVVR